MPDHPVELKLLGFMSEALKGNTTVTEEVADKVASDVKAAFLKQFSGESRGDFKLRMSNIGKPSCQLWFEKNDPDDREPLPPFFLMNMILGDIVEAVFKGLLTAAGVEYKDNYRVSLDLPTGDVIDGELDMEMDGKIDDVKSASPWSYTNKFESFEKLSEKDDFGYVAQLVGYAHAANKDVGGWWVVNKANGEFKYVDASSVNVSEVLLKVQEKVTNLNNNAPFKRCFSPVEESYYKKKSGNLVLPNECKFCPFKRKCWETLQTLPSKVSKAKEPPMVDYILVT
jgi:hypothetical protein